MEGDEKRTPGQRLDEAMQDKDFWRVEIKIVYIKPKTESPKPGRPTKKTR